MAIPTLGNKKANLSPCFRQSKLKRQKLLFAPASSSGRSSLIYHSGGQCRFSCSLWEKIPVLTLSWLQPASQILKTWRCLFWDRRGCSKIITGTIS